MPNYGDHKYWEERYMKEAGTTFDWLETFHSLKNLLIKYINP